MAYLYDDWFVTKVNKKREKTDVKSCRNLGQLVQTVELHDRRPIEKRKYVAKKLEAAFGTINHLSTIT